MELIRCHILNYRSIKDLTIDFNKKRLNIFIGFNEAGKSNIIKALSLLIQTNKTTKDDIREYYSDDDQNNGEAYVRFVFQCSDAEIEQLFQQDIKKILVKNEKDIEIISNLYHENKQILYRADVSNGNKEFQYWAINKEYQLNGKLKKVNKDIRQQLTLEGKSYFLPNYDYVILDDSVDISNVKNALIDIQFDELINLLFESKQVLLQENFPHVVYWSFNNSKDIPAKIKITSFIEDNNKYVPLKNMFKLSNINDIKEEIENAQGKKNGLNNLLAKISKDTTDYIHKAWTEQKTIEITLRENGDNIEFVINDEKNQYDFSRRSDGFKRFVYFLLEIAAQNKAGTIKDIILLIDEPDIGLHPSSSRQLMKELVNISKNNFVFYATHSIFMINKEDISFHFIVIKEKEITQIQKIDSSNIVDAEVLYNALGYSVFEILKNDNIIFEGWKDKHLFDISQEHFKNNEKIEKCFNNIGTCYSQGVKDIQRIIAMLDLVKRNYIIISDADAVAREAKKKSHEKNRWFMYDIIDKNVVTSEDFLKIDYANACFHDICGKYDLPVNTVSIQQNNILEQYKSILREEKKKSDEIKDIIDEYKEYLFQELSVDKINDTYFKFIEEIIIPHISSGLLDHEETN
jgi:predicted ATP-dependent endonuclease of OLD family